MTPEAKPLSKRRVQTRQRLIAAATEVVAGHGFHAASVDQIAHKAGLSIGGLYSNFANKDELLFAVFDHHVAWFEGQLDAVVASDDAAGAIGSWITSLGDNPQQFLVFIEFWAYAIRKPKVRRDFAARLVHLRTSIAAVIESRAAERGVDPPMPPDALAYLAMAIGRGVAIEVLADPGAVPDSTITELLAGFIG